MITIDQFRSLAMSLADATEEPHFEKTSFRIKKKIFATYDAKNHLACLKLSETDQDIYSLMDKTVVYPVPNKWGNQGWTMVDLSKIDTDVFVEILNVSYAEVSKKKKK